MTFNAPACGVSATIAIIIHILTSIIHSPVCVSVCLSQWNLPVFLIFLLSLFARFSNALVLLHILFTLIS